MNILSERNIFAQAWEDLKSFIQQNFHSLIRKAEEMMGQMSKQDIEQEVRKVDDQLSKVSESTIDEGLLDIPGWFLEQYFRLLDALGGREIVSRRWEKFKQNLDAYVGSGMLTKIKGYQILSPDEVRMETQYRSYLYTRNDVRTHLYLMFTLALAGLVYGGIAYAAPAFSGIVGLLQYLIKSSGIIDYLETAAEFIEEIGFHTYKGLFGQGGIFGEDVDVQVGEGYEEERLALEKEYWMALDSLEKTKKVEIGNLEDEVGQEAARMKVSGEAAEKRAQIYNDYNLKFLDIRAKYDIPPGEELMPRPNESVDLEIFEAWDWLERMKARTGDWLSRFIQPGIELAQGWLENPSELERTVRTTEQQLLNRRAELNKVEEGAVLDVISYPFRLVGSTAQWLWDEWWVRGILKGRTEWIANRLWDARYHKYFDDKETFLNLFYAAVTLGVIFTAVSYAAWPVVGPILSLLFSYAAEIIYAFIDALRRVV